MIPGLLLMTPELAVEVAKAAVTAADALECGVSTEEHLVDDVLLTLASRSPRDFYLLFNEYPQFRALRDGQKRNRTYHACGAEAKPAAGYTLRVNDANSARGSISLFSAERNEVVTFSSDGLVIGEQLEFGVDLEGDPFHKSWWVFTDYDGNGTNDIMASGSWLRSDRPSYEQMMQWVRDFVWQVFSKPDSHLELVCAPSEPIPVSRKNRQPKQPARRQQFAKR